MPTFCGRTRMQPTGSIIRQVDGIRGRRKNLTTEGTGDTEESNVLLYTGLAETMFIGHRHGSWDSGQFWHESRDAQPDGGGFFARVCRRRGAGGWGGGIRSGSGKVFDFGRAQQVPAAFVVGRAEY